MNEVIAEISYEKVWNDCFYIAVFENEACLEYDQPEFLNANASKKIMFKEIGNLSNFSTDIIFLIDNIVNLESVIVINYRKKAIITINSNRFTINISENLKNLIKKMKK